MAFVDSHVSVALFHSHIQVHSLNGMPCLLEECAAFLSIWNELCTKCVRLGHIGRVSWCAVPTQEGSVAVEALSILS